MNEEQKQEFFEWYQLMKDRAREVWNDPEVRPEFKQIFVQSATEPIGIWRDRRQRPGQQKPTQDQPQNSSNAVKNEAKPTSPQQPHNQPVQQQKSPDPKSGWKPEVLRLLNEFPQSLERKSQSKIKIVREIPRSEWNSVKEGFEKEGWRYDWREKAFMISEEMKA